MTGPALVVLAHGSRDPRSGVAVQEIVTSTRRLHPDAAVEAAFLDHNAPDLSRVVERLARAGHREIVVVPLFLSAAYHARFDSPAAVSRAQERYPGVTLRLADVVGSDPSLLTALDDRLFEVLRSTRNASPDALVLASAGTSDPAANEAVAALARLWGQRHRLPASAAFASTTTPSTGEAVRQWRRAGYRRVAVGSWFIAPGTLPDRVQDLANQAGVTAVSRPLGAHGLLCQAILDRYLVSASAVLV